MSQKKLQPGVTEIKPHPFAASLLVCDGGEHELYFRKTCQNHLFEIFVVAGSTVTLRCRDGIEFSDGKSQQGEAVLAEQKIHRVLGGEGLHLTDFPLGSAPAKRQAKVSKSQEVDEE